MADFGKRRESFQTPQNASYVLANGFPTTLGIVGEDFAWIPKGPKIGRFWLPGSELRRPPVQ